MAAGLLISELFANPAGNDSPFEYVELIATQSINFATTPYTVIFANNGSATTNGWIAGAGITYGFSITSGSVTSGQVVYVGGSSMAPTGTKLRTIDTRSVGSGGSNGDNGLGNGADGGVLGNGGANADAVGVFDLAIASITDTTVPIDAVFFGTGIGTAVNSGGADGYVLPINDLYPGGFLQATSFFAPDPLANTIFATGAYNPAGAGIFTTNRTWATGSLTDGTSSITVAASANPSVNLSVSNNAGSEASPAAITVTATASSAVTGNQTVNLAVTGTGITAGDFNLSGTTITIPNGQTFGTQTFTVVDDASVEGTETATLTISAPSSGITLGATTSQNIVITDNDVSATPSVNLSVSSNAGSEATPAAITVTATASSAVTGDQTVNLAVTGTGITAGDFNLSGTTITILSGQTTGTQTFTVVDDALVEGSETATLTISAPSSGISLGTTTSQNIVITDNDVLVTKISTIQGTGTAATPGTFTIEGIVVGDFQATGQIGGFFVQEEDSDIDGNPLTSEGISVFNSLTPVGIGDKVRVTGTVVEFGSGGNTLTQLGNATVMVMSSNNALPTAATVDLPVAAFSDLERFEGMRVTLPETLTVSETFTLARFGEVLLSADGRRFQPTEFVDPNDNPAGGTISTGTSNVAAVTSQQNANNLRAITLDDGLSTQNLATIPYLNAQNTRRIGDTVTGLTGVLDQRFPGSTNPNGYRIQPTGTVTFADTNPRPLAPPSVGGTLKVGSFNLLNYFTTLDQGSNLTGPNNNLEPRGSENATEFSRQRQKTATTIFEINADILGLIELENNGTTAITDLVNAVNAKAGAGTYAFIQDPVGYTTNPGGDDAIKVAFIYKPSVVTPLGNSLSPANATAFLQLGRAPVAQTFLQNSNGAVFTPVVNHFKSKGAGGASGTNLDQNDGQGAFNAQRKLQAEALVNFINNTVIPTAGDSDVLILGDLNSYGQEDPIDLIRNAGFIDQIDRFDGNSTSYSFVFEGQSGRLDHALATPSLNGQVTGAAEWHINADEPIFLDYNLNFKVTPPNDLGFNNASTPDFFNSANSFRSSDHDPSLVGLNLTPRPSTATAGIINTRPTSNGGTLVLGTNTNDNITGSTNSDTIAAFSGNDFVFGADGNDSINGGFGDDTLLGSNGADTLIGNIGNDSLIGGTGNDFFVYNSFTEGTDTIADFASGDKILIQALAFGGLTSVNLLVNAAFGSATPGFLFNSTSGLLSFDADGNGVVAPVAIATLTGVANLISSDITLF
jgi:predicted extracellular nuclease